MSGWRSNSLLAVRQARPGLRLELRGRHRGRPGACMSFGIPPLRSELGQQAQRAVAAYEWMEELLSTSDSTSSPWTTARTARTTSRTTWSLSCPAVFRRCGRSWASNLRER
eukprot:8616448-Heterocapsa_arctica.AAC.2